tara:strand:- start:106 stop:375 length:270 start_codon:yes stop_codon:yes gene_type:complete
MSISPDTSIEFPCNFPIKVIGRNADNLMELVISVIRAHISDFQAQSVNSRESGQGKYVSVTVTVRVTDKSVLDGIYRDLSKNQKVIMVL